METDFPKIVSNTIVRLVNENPELQSALYDMNLLPEQIFTKAQADALTYFAGGFALGRKYKTVDASKEQGKHPLRGLGCGARATVEVWGFSGDHAPK